MISNDFKRNFIQDEDKEKPLGKEALFDRIINLKLTTSDKDNVVKDVYVIRSDYEIYYPKLNEIITGTNLRDIKDGFIRRCRQKPSIKVQYKQISSGTAIEIDVFVSNFFLLSSDGKTLMSFNNLTYPVSKMEIQMGYRGQFNEPKSLKDYFNFQPQNGAEVIECTVDYSQTDKLPPDSVLHIHGFVGNCYGKSVASLKETEVTIDSFKNNIPTKRDTIIEEFFYRNITRKFLRSAVLDKNEKIVIDPSIGMMTSVFADKYGIQVHCSKALIEASKKVTSQFRIKDADEKSIDAYVGNFDANSPINALNQVRNYLSLPICFKLLKNGDYIAFLESEAGNAEQLANDFKMVLATEKNATVSTYWKNKLPAVYNITTDAICTIVCPFFYFVDPFQVLKFSSRYALGGIVSYYANFNATENEFYALWMQVSFATVEDINECQIACTGKAV